LKDLRFFDPAPADRPVAAKAVVRGAFFDGLTARGAVARALALLSAAGLAACASLSDDVHLAPLVSHLSLAGGADEHEALAGAVRVLRDAPGAGVREWELHPLVCREHTGDGSLARFLVPFGHRRVEPERTTTELLPIFRFQREPDANGRPSWRLIALPGILWGEDSTGRVFRGVFPIGGVWEDFATYDRITFVLFPLYLRTEREGGTFHHVLWPIFSWGRNGRGELDWHLWPVYGVARPGSSESTFVLWPLYLRSTSRIYLPEEHQVRRWMVWPFYGRTESGSYRAWTVLWPFFGRAHDRESGFWAWDGPWPFVRITRPGTSGEAYRTRAWPFYSHYEGDGLTSRWVLWPIFHQRHETYADGSVRQGENLLPFWQHYVERDAGGRERGRWHKLWPLYQYKEREGVSRLGAPTLLPLWELPDVDEHYAWIWELYRREVDAAGTHERSWGGLWRRESDAYEERAYLAGLWSRRKLREGDQTVRETSLLFGLVRWRSTKASRFDLLRPAFPGPGWPARAAH
jgi:hypothetical protein